MIHDNRICLLGEGPLWHPVRQELFWFDILQHRLMHKNATPVQFDEHVSAAGWVDQNTLMVASATALWSFDIATNARTRICDLEADNPTTRSNDGRADPYGGFWIGTMGLKAEEGAGAIYRYYKGELRQLFAPISISNAICFDPAGGFALFTDTPTQKIMKVALDNDGWPKGEAELWLDLSGTKWRPDGAVIDASGNFWNAQWGGSRVACYDPDGMLVEAIGFGAQQTTCPAFGGENFGTLFCTSAAVGLENSLNPHQGKTFACETTARGQAEHQVIL